MGNSLQNKVAIVTGASTGIGLVSQSARVRRGSGGHHRPSPSRAECDRCGDRPPRRPASARMSRKMPPGPRG